MFEDVEWKNLNPLQIGRFAEYFVKMFFSSNGFEVYAPEVDDHGIDFIVRSPKTEKFYEIQVKSVFKAKYIFFPKSKFELRHGLVAAIVLFPTETKKQEPKLYLIPSTEWNNPNKLLVDRPYDKGQKSPAEWGINISSKQKEILEKQYKAKSVIGNLVL